MMISWGELQGYHLVWIGIIEAGEEQESIYMVSSGWTHSLTYHISLVPLVIGVFLFLLFNSPSP